MAFGESLESLLLQVAAGDRVAFRRLYDEVSARLFAVCLALLRNRARAEDILQDAFIRIWDRAYLYDPAKGGAYVWMVVLTRRLALNALRSAAPLRIEETESDVADFPNPVESGDPIARRRLVVCLDLLPEPQKDAILLAYLHGWTHEELSRRFDRPMGTVKSWLFRGLAELRSCLK